MIFVVRDKNAYDELVIKLKSQKSFLKRETLTNPFQSANFSHFLPGVVLEVGMGWFGLGLMITQIKPLFNRVIFLRSKPN